MAQSGAINLLKRAAAPLTTLAMALLTIQQVRDLAKTKNERKSVIASVKTAKNHSQDIRFHTEAEVSENTLNASYGRFLSRVDGYLVKDKFKVFKKYHRFPLATTATCSHILSQLNKVFDGKNAIRSSSFVTENVESDFLQYLKESQFHKNWRTDSLRSMASGVNSILIVDMPQDRPDPYFYFLSIEDVWDMDVDESGNIIWVQFWQSDFHLAHISQDGWQVYKTEEARGGKIESLERESANESGKDICWFWWEENVKAKDKILKKSPFTEWISKLDWLEIWSTWKRMLDAFGSNPVMWAIQEDCDHNDDKMGVHCDGGYLKRNADNSFVRGEASYVNGGYEKCPKCSDKRFTAPGTVMEIPPPDKDGDFRAPFGVVDIAKKSLDNARDEEIRLKEELIKGITGGGSEPMNQEAINVTQVSALFEGWTGILRQLKKSFESSEEKLLEVMAALRYGGDVLDMAINYGNEFYLMSEQEALIFYTAARDFQLPDYILDFLLGEYYKTKFRFDKKGFERVKILMSIEPFKHITKEKVVGIAEQVTIDHTELYLKLNFGSLTQRFELENGSVAEFGVNMQTGAQGDAFAQRVAKIKSVMVSYIPEPKEQKVS